MHDPSRRLADPGVREQEVAHAEGAVDKETTLERQLDALGVAREDEDLFLPPRRVSHVVEGAQIRGGLRPPRGAQVPR